MKTYVNKRVGYSLNIFWFSGSGMWNLFVPDIQGLSTSVLMTQHSSHSSNKLRDLDWKPDYYKHLYFAETFVVQKCLGIISELIRE